MTNRDWEHVVLGSLVDIKHGFPFKGEFFSDIPTTNILLTPGNFSIGGGFNNEKKKYYNGLFPSNYVLSEGEVIVTMTDLSKTGDTLGYPAVIPKSEDVKYLHNQRLGRILIKDSNRLDKQFLYYLMCTPEYRHEILASSTGTTVKHTSPDRIKKFKFRLPPLAEQKSIATVLGSLNYKIELNRTINERLEEIGQLLFNKWFMDFQFPNEDDEPYKLSGGEMIDSEIGEIPQGWSTGSLGDIAENHTRLAHPREVPSGTPYIGLEHMPRKSIALWKWGSAGNVKSNKLAFHEGEILFGKLRPYFHKVGVAIIDGVCSTDIVIIAPKQSGWFAFTLLHVSSTAFINYTDATSNGTKMPRTSWTDMAHYQIAIPPYGIAENFNRIIHPFVLAIRSNVLQSHILSSIRDALLPNLLSGKIKVTNPVKIVDVKKHD